MVFRAENVEERWDLLSLEIPLDRGQTGMDRHLAYHLYHRVVVLVKALHDLNSHLTVSPEAYRLENGAIGTLADGLADPVVARQGQFLYLLEAQDILVGFCAILFWLLITASEIGFSGRFLLIFRQNGFFHPRNLKTLL